MDEAVGLSRCLDFVLDVHVDFGEFGGVVRSRDESDGQDARNDAEEYTGRLGGRVDGIVEDDAGEVAPLFAGGCGDGHESVVIAELANFVSAEGLM